MKKIAFVISLTFLAHGHVPASDHIDGPITTKHAVTDLTDLFVLPTPNTPGSLTLILNAYPFAPSYSHFPERVTYTFFIRKAQIATVGGHPNFQTGEEVRVSCECKTPHDSTRHMITCQSSSGLQAASLVNETSSKGDFRVFFGLRSDPFFFNAKWAVSVSTRAVLLPPQKSNSMTSLNVLSIVIDIDTSKLFANSSHSLLAVAANSTTQDDATAPVRQLDRIGRPEITNVTMVANGAKDLRDLYNKEPPFSSFRGDSPYRTRLRDNIAFYDRIDGKVEWPEGDKEALADLLLDDFLVIDLAKPSGPDDFFEIEKALLEGKEHVSCGGRKPTDDIMDTLLTYYINRGRGPVLRDGVDKPAKAISNLFPYLAAPSTGVWAKAKSAFARWYFGQ
jgi:hypothetical protein